MKTIVGLFAVFSLIILMIVPVYADVDKITIDKETFAIDEKFTISGTISDAGRVTLLASMKGPSGERLVHSIRSDIGGTFSFQPVRADDLFRSKGIYTINVFADTQLAGSGPTIKIEYSRGVATVLPDFDLVLKEIGNKTVDEGTKLSFTVSVTDSTINDIEFSLEKYPNGAKIDKDTGVFSWTPTNTQSGGYIFDVVVNAYPFEDRETITITVNDKPGLASTPEPKEKEPGQTESKKLELAAFVDESKDPQSYVDRYNSDAGYKDWFDKNYSWYSSIYEAVGLEEPLLIPAAFVDESKDPQSYVDRYNSEVGYKNWFDSNHSEYSSIYQAVGLDEPKELASFVDESKDPQSYVDRYNSEENYKDWFDKTYPDITIYQAVGLDESKEKEKQFGTCGEGTRLIDEVCTIFEESEFGQCGEGTELVGKVCEIIGKTDVKPWWQFW